MIQKKNEEFYPIELWWELQKYNISEFGPFFELVQSQMTPREANLFGILEFSLFQKIQNQMKDVDSDR